MLTKAAVLNAGPREFELLETMRHEPRRGLRNRDRHLQRLAGSAEHLGSEWTCRPRESAVLASAAPPEVASTVWSR